MPLGPAWGSHPSTPASLLALGLAALWCRAEEGALKQQEFLVSAHLAGGSAPSSLHQPPFLACLCGWPWGCLLSAIPAWRGACWVACPVPPRPPSAWQTAHLEGQGGVLGNPCRAGALPSLTSVSTGPAGLMGTHPLVSRKPVRGTCSRPQLTQSDECLSAPGLEREGLRGERPQPQVGAWSPPPSAWASYL